MVEQKADQDVDWAGLKFKIMGELGEPIDITLVRLKGEGGPQYYAVTHDRADGLGAMTRLSNKVYGRAAVPSVGLKASTKPTLLRRCLFVVQHLWRQRSVTYRWQLKKPFSTREPEAFAYYCFSRDNTQKLKRYCQERGHNVNSLLLFYLDRYCRAHFLSDDSNKKRVWMIPVNVREAHEQSLFGNYVTALSIAVTDQDRATTLYQQMRGLLKSGIAWGGKIVAGSSRLLGEERLRKIAASGKIKSPYCGLLTDLGRWTFTGDQEDDPWLVIAPAATPTPIACALMEVNGRLALSYQLHPDLGGEEACLALCDSMVKDMAAAANLVLQQEATSVCWREVKDKITYY